MEIEVIQYRFRVDVFCQDTEIAGTLLRITDIAHTLTLGRKLLHDIIGIGQRHQFNGPGPETLRQWLNAMPVIDRRIEPQLRFVNAVHPQPAVGYRGDWHPGLKVRVHFERVATVVLEDPLQFPRVNQQRIQFVAR
ncbi:hypothetical protein D3C78_1316830 [compost metagenome]